MTDDRPGFFAAVPPVDRHALNADRITQYLEQMVPSGQIGIPVADQPENGAWLPGFKTTQYHGIEIVWDEYMGCDYGRLPDRMRPWWHWRRLWNMRPWNKETP